MNATAACLDLLGALLAVAAIAIFLRKGTVARWLVIGAVLATTASLGLVFLNQPKNALQFWAVIFAMAGIGCLGNGFRHLKTRTGRWVHRFVIYDGYGAVLVVMAAFSLLAGGKAFPGWQVTAMLVGLYVAGSTAIFLAKSVNVRAANRLVPGYADMVANQAEAAGHW
jgi:peptidoglycan/LPS O-acetylase OafA/YrhL